MEKIEKSFLVAHNSQKMFNLVMDVKSYPNFLPWCNSATILNEHDDIVEARLGIKYLTVNNDFSTRNQFIKDKEIRIKLLNGPFEYLDGYWKFNDFSDFACKVEFKLVYEFSSHMFSKILSPILSYISSNLVQSFIKEADNRYGRK